MSNWLREGNKLHISCGDCTSQLDVEHLDNNGIALTIITPSNEVPYEDIKTTMYLFGRELEVLKKFIQEEQP
jgi:hypothetical protein